MPPRQNEVNFKGFVQIELNEDDYKILEGTNLSGEEVVLHLAAIISKRYRLSLTADTEGHRVKATLMDTDTTRSSAGWMLSAESDTLFEALIVLFYKHEAKMGSNWVPFCNSTRQIAKYR